MPRYPENLIHFCNPVLEHYELKDEMGRMFKPELKEPAKKILDFWIEAVAKEAELAAAATTATPTTDDADLFGVKTFA